MMIDVTLRLPVRAAFASLLFVTAIASGQDDTESQLNTIGERLGRIEDRLTALEGRASADERQAAGDAEQVTEVVEVKGDIDRAESLASAMGEGIKVRRVEGAANMLALSGPGSAVAAAWKLIEQYDKPARVIEVTVQLLDGNAGAQSVEVPDDLKSVATELSGIFGYESFSLRDTVVLRTRDGEGASSSGLLAPAGEAPTDGETPYKVSFVLARIDESDGGETVKFERFLVDYQIEYTSGTGSIERKNLVITTDLDVKVGQQVVVGKGRPNGANRGAQFVVVSVKVLD